MPFLLSINFFNAHLIPLAIVVWHTLVVTDKIGLVADILGGAVVGIAHTGVIAFLVIARPGLGIQTTTTLPHPSMSNFCWSVSLKYQHF